MPEMAARPCDQLGTILDQFLGAHGKDIELRTADHKSEVLEQAADLVLEIPLDLDQQRPARQQRPDRVAMERDLYGPSRCFFSVWISEALPAGRFSLRGPRVIATFPG
jgi:hypothetical protein